jgi:hypothetical protein
VRPEMLGSCRAGPAPFTAVNPFAEPSTLLYQAPAFGR